MLCPPAACYPLGHSRLMAACSWKFQTQVAVSRQKNAAVFSLLITLVKPTALDWVWPSCNPSSAITMAESQSTVLRAAGPRFVSSFLLTQTNWPEAKSVRKAPKPAPEARRWLAPKSTPADCRRRSQYSGLSVTRFSTGWSRSDRIGQCRQSPRLGQVSVLRLDPFRCGNARQRRPFPAGRSQSPGRDRARGHDVRPSPHRYGSEGNSTRRSRFLGEAYLDRQTSADR